MRVLSGVPFAIDRPRLARDAGLDPADAEGRTELEGLVAEAEARGRPKACFRRVAVAVESDGRTVRLDGERFTSALLAENLARVDEAWLYLATCGRELHDWARGLKDPFAAYGADMAARQALDTARRALDAALRGVFAGKTAAMSPGSLPEWPLEEQRPLFRLMDEGARAIGVTLEESLLMLPGASISGVRFANEHGYVNCRLCPRERCPNRRAPYDASLARAVRSHGAGDEDEDAPPGDGREP